MTRPHHRPLLPGETYFQQLPEGADPATTAEASQRTARLLVRGARDSDDPAVRARIISLAENEGIEALADLWASSPPDTLAGSLWRLYLLGTWVRTAPEQAAREFESGRFQAPVAEIVAGVGTPPSPEDMCSLVDAVLAGICDGDYADTLFRAAAFAHIAAVGRREASSQEDQPLASYLSAERLMRLSEQLSNAGHLELRGLLG